MYEMKPEYYTGIKSIDDEHTKLFAIANECYDLLTNQFLEDKYDYILKVINDLKDYTKYHFKNEEEYMESIGYKKLLSQKVSHNDFIEKINSYNYDHIDENQKDTLLELLDFLTTWLVDHILMQDTLIGK